MAWAAERANPHGNSQTAASAASMQACLTRCAWCSPDPLYRAYHDEEWGVPLHDERALFELLTLEGAQAGLSWLTILKKREGYRRAFDHFDVERIARYDAADVARLMADAGIVRNRLKIESTITNARATLALRETGAGWTPTSGISWTPAPSPTRGRTSTKCRPARCCRTRSART